MRTRNGTFIFYEGEGKPFRFPGEVVRGETRMTSPSSGPHVRAQSAFAVPLRVRGPLFGPKHDVVGHVGNILPLLSLSGGKKKQLYFNYILFLFIYLFIYFSLFYF